jgi:uncharacterized protein
MTTEVLVSPERQVAARQGIIDCDIHPLPQSLKSLYPYLARRWREHLDTFGVFPPEPFLGHPHYVKATPLVGRRDAWPTSGGPPGSDVDFMRRQHLDPLEVDHGMLVPMYPNPAAERNSGLAEALSSAVNDWQLAEFAEKEPRLRPAIVVPREDPKASVKEMELRARDDRFVQVLLRPFALEPLGRKRYWPILDAAAALNLPVGIHPGGMGAFPGTASGWPSYYMEEHFVTISVGAAVITSLIMEGVLEKLPNLKIVLMESGFAWAPSLGWRLDRLWERDRAEVPHVKRPPSTYLKTNIYFTTQPIEEPHDPAFLRQTFDWIGWDQLLFSSDYPHWDYDDPSYVLPFQASPAERRQLMHDNALRVYERLVKNGA